MSCQYSDNGNQATTTSTNKTATSVQSIAGLRPQIYGWSIGADGAPNSTDCSIVYTLQLWTTSAGTSTAFTPNPLDPGFQGAKASCGINFTGEPTYTAGATPWGPIGLNQRASQVLWLPPAAPVVLVGTATTGIGMQVKSTNYGGQTDVILYHQE